MNLCLIGLCPGLSVDNWICIFIVNLIANQLKQCSFRSACLCFHHVETIQLICATNHLPISINDNNDLTRVNPLEPSVAFHIETSHFIDNAKQMTGFYMKCNNGLKWFNLLITSPHINKKGTVFQVEW